MKTIVRKGSNVSLYVLNDDVSIIIGESMTQVGIPAEFMIADCNQDNAVVFERVTPPDDWAGGGYTYDGETWAIHKPT